MQNENIVSSYFTQASEHSFETLWYTLEQHFNFILAPTYTTVESENYLRPIFWPNNVQYFMKYSTHAEYIVLYLYLDVVTAKRKMLSQAMIFVIKAIM